MVGRGNLNPICIILIYKVNDVFYFWLEYQLEYLCEIALQLTAHLHSI